MNLTKARDFYSAYFEGSLDDGLKQAFERALSSDAEVSAEYRQFVRIMQELKALDAPVSIPPDLHNKIRERVDANIIALERKSRSGSWFFAWKPIAYGAVATAAIIGVVASFSNRPSSGVGQAGSGFELKDQDPKFTLEDGTVRLKFASTKKNLVTVTDVASGQRLFSKTVVQQAIDSPITNLSELPILVTVSFADAYSPIYVAIPGSKVTMAEKGNGTVLQLVTAVAGMYGAPVVVEARALGNKVDWVLDSPDVMAALRDELKAVGLKAEIRENGLVWISSN